MIWGLFIASVVTQSFAQRHQCDCASSAPICKPLPAPSSNSCVKVPRTDCPCCLVCAGQLQDPCEPNSQPCDSFKGLICDSTTHLCSKEVRPCQHEGGLKQPGETFHSNDCQKQCTCSLEGELLCQPIICPSGLLPRGSSSNKPFCQEVVQHFPDNSSNNTLNLCCVKVVCATFANDEFRHAENDKSSNEPSLVDTSSSSFENDPDLRSVDTVSNHAHINNDANLHTDVPLDHGDREFEQPVLHIPNHDVPLDFGDYEHEQPEFHIPEKLSPQLDDERQMITFPTSTLPTISHTSADDGGLNLVVLQVTQNSVQVRFPGITGGNLMYVEERLYRMGTRGAGNSASHHSSVHLDHAHIHTPWENAIILEGNKIYTLTALNPGTLYRLRWQAPDKQYPDIMVSTQARDEKPPKVIMTSKSFDSVTLSFDHFAPKGYTHGYVAMFKKVEGGRINQWIHQEQSEDDLRRSRPGDPPSIRINGLLPNTAYMARIAIYSDYSLRSFGKTSGIIEFQTENGCSYKGSSYALGSFNIGCEFSCECTPDGEASCNERCRSPFHPIGTTAGDPLCVEQSVDGDRCCVTIICSNHAPSIDGSHEHGPCKGIKCGPNAECRHEVFRTEAHTETICVCKDGYTGDPDNLNIGCAAHISNFPVNNVHGIGQISSELHQRDGCQVKNETYAVGAEWFDGCEYRCICSGKKETLCQPRCEVLPEGVDHECELRPDPKDSCCNVMYCPDPNTMNHDLKLVGLSFDGCVHKKKSYHKGERFYDGCEQQCQCIGNGDIVCIARCSPTTKVSPGQNCYTLADASDPCCNITVCDDPILDPDQNVQKEGIKTMTRPSRILTSDVNEDEVGSPIPGTSYTGLKIGEFTEYHYGVGGTVYALNESTLFIKDFQYTGGGPDAFFWAGTQSEHPDRNGIILAYPYDGIHYEYEDPKAPVLGRFEAGRHENVILHLPKDVRVSDLKWLSVWCRAYSVNFGDVIWPENIFQVSETDDTLANTISTASNACMHKGKVYSIGEDFYDDCNAFCMCITGSLGAPELICNPIKCPSSFGLDVINPFCLRWDEHSDFVAKPPMCCPPLPVCLSDGSCEYKGEKFNNYDNIPQNLTGCENRCYCENAEVLCRDACYELSDTPPTYLRCSAKVATKVPKEDRPCCLVWGCPQLPALPATQLPLTYERLNATAIRIRVRVPRVLDGRTGFFKVYHSSGLESHPDPNQWPVKDISPQDGLFNVTDDEQAEFVLTELLPNKQYFLKTFVNVRDDNMESGYQVLKSGIVPISPPPEPPIDVPRRRKIDIQLEVAHITSTSATIKWRFFATHEKQYIDGAQIRFVQLQDGKAASGVPGTTPFIHRDTNFFLLEELKPDTEYQVDVYIIPVPQAEEELVSDDVSTFRTMAKVQDPYDFDIELKADTICQHLVDVSWSGVPMPHQQYVNVYRILYIEEDDINAIPDSVFKVAKINSMRATRIGYLRSGISYSMWLEAYLGNGKVIKSNVLDVKTQISNRNQSPECKHFDDPLRGLQHDPYGEGDNKTFYNGMVIASIIAAVGLLALIIVTSLYLKRTTTYKAIISGGKKSEFAFNNKAFTTENVRRGKASVPKTRPISENGNNSIEMNGVHIQNGNAPENNGNTIQKVDLYPENRPKQSASPPPVKPRPPPR